VPDTPTAPKPKAKKKPEIKARPKETGFQVGSTVELDVPSHKEVDDQLGLFEN
jgi:hypothetical protein